MFLTWLRTRCFVGQGVLAGSEIQKSTLSAVLSQDYKISVGLLSWKDGWQIGLRQTYVHVVIIVCLATPTPEANMIVTTGLS